MVDLRPGHDMEIPFCGGTMSIYWHRPSLNLGWYPIAEYERNNSLLLHSEGPENPEHWEDFLHDVFARMKGE